MNVHLARKKPVTVKVSDPMTPENRDEIRDWIKASTDLPWHHDSDFALFIYDDPKGDQMPMIVEWGDRIICQGDVYYPINAGNYAREFEPVFNATAY